MLDVNRLSCRACQTEVSGQYGLPTLARLAADDQAFVRQFVKASGSLKEMARLMQVSYPTVRNRLDAVIAKLNELGDDDEH
jgi:hypothetical protein